MIDSEITNIFSFKYTSFEEILVDVSFLIHLLKNFYLMLPFSKKIGSKFLN